MSVKDWQRFSELLDEWKEDPVTVALKEAMDNVISRKREALLSAFWAGQETSEDRRVLLNVEAWVEAFFNATAEEVRAEIEDEDEPQWNHPDVG